MRARNPKKCGCSVDVYGVYVCRAQVLPCGAVRKCPIYEGNDMLDALKQAITACEDAINDER